VSLAVFCYVTRNDGDTIDLDEEEERAELIHRLLGQLPNLCDIDIDIVSASQSAAIIDNLSSRHELRKLCLAGGREFVLPPKQISRLLSNLPHLDTLKLTFMQYQPWDREHEALEPDPEGPAIMKTIASMRHLTTFHFNISSIDGSWAIPFASGGLSELQFDKCPNIDLAGLEAILSPTSLPRPFQQLVILRRIQIALFRL
jgi:hypothetical protein